MIEDAGDLFRGIERAAVGVHVENDRDRAGTFRGLLGPPEKDGERLGDLALQRHDHDVAAVDGLFRRLRTA